MENDAPIPAAVLPFSTPGNIRRYRSERPLFVTLAIVAVFILTCVTLLTAGLVWIFLLWMYLIYLTVASYFITYLRGNSVEVTAEQFPALYARFCACCTITGVTKRPKFYLLAGDGMRNAFAARFLNRYYVVLLSDIVDALDEDDDGLNFYIGHELGHIAQKHIARMWWLRVAMGIPLLGAAYSRAREYTCDQYGLACCSGVRSAVHALSVLAVGGKRWKTMNTAAYVAQGKDSGGFWMALNELTGDYPWLCKRVARIERGDLAQFPRRNVFAWIIAALVPRTGMGLIGAIVLYSYLLVIGLYMLLVLASPSILGSILKLGNFGGASRGHFATVQEAAPSSEEVLTLLRVTAAYDEGLLATDKVDTFVEKKGKLPTTLAQVGVELDPASPVEAISMMEGSEATLEVRMKAPDQDITLLLVPALQDRNRVSWKCTGGPGVKQAVLPPACSSADGT